MNRTLRRPKWLPRAGLMFNGDSSAIQSNASLLSFAVSAWWQNVRSALTVASMPSSGLSNGFEEEWPRTKLSKKCLLSPHFQPFRISSATSAPGLRWPLTHALVCALIWWNAINCNIDGVQDGFAYIQMELCDASLKQLMLDSNVRWDEEKYRTLLKQVPIQIRYHRTQQAKLQVCICRCFSDRWPQESSTYTTKISVIWT